MNFDVINHSSEQELNDKLKIVDDQINVLMAERQSLDMALDQLDKARNVIVGILVYKQVTTNKEAVKNMTA